MIQEDKILLLKDLYARLPYGFFVHRYSDNADIRIDNISTFGYFLEYSEGEDFKPYIRPMSSMTEDEQKTLDSMCYGVEMVSRLSGLKMFDKAFDWLNINHFDYRGLIEKGLALEAPEGMYK